VAVFLVQEFYSASLASTYIDVSLADQKIGPLDP
jgi:hypothetical protein